MRLFVEKLKSKSKELSVASKNKILVNVKTFLNFYKLEYPPVFEHIEILTATLKKFPIEEKFAFHFSADELQLILEKALEHDCELCSITRKMHDRGKNFRGQVPLKNVPIFPHLALFAFTGMRKEEGLTFKWEQVNLNSGLIKVKALKTNKIRTIQLIGSNNGDISPLFLEMLKVWKNMIY